MNKYFKTYLVTWAVFLAIFNVCTFALPNYMMSYNKFTSSFWIVYGFVMAAFLGHVGCTYLVCQSKSKEKLFLNTSILITSYSALTSTLAVGIACMRIPKVPSWVCVITCVLTFGFNALSVLGAKTGSDVVSEIDEKIKVETFFVKSLTIDADTLMSRASTEEAKAACKKVYEAIRYSDPMSNPALASAESQITLRFEAFKNAVLSNEDNIGDLSNELVILINDRNKKCMLLK